MGYFGCPYKDLVICKNNNGCLIKKKHTSIEYHVLVKVTTKSSTARIKDVGILLQVVADCV